MRDAFATGKRSLRCLDLTCFFLAERVVAIGDAGQGSGDRINIMKGRSSNCDFFRNVTMTSTRWFSGLTMARALFMIEVRGGAVW